MDLIIKTYKENNTLVIWSVDIPRLGIEESEPFLVYGYNWNLKLNVNVCTIYGKGKCVELKVTLHNSTEKNTPNTALTFYIRYEGRYLYLNTVEIKNNDTDIWYEYYSELRKKYPDIGNRLQFMLKFHSKITDTEAPNKGHISGETSEDYPCLKNLSLDLSKLVENGTDTGVQLKCGDISVGVHKLILGARSEVFRAMMQSDMVESRDGIVEISDMEPEILNTFIRFFYSGILPEITVDNAIQIYEAADKYQVEALKNRSSRFLVKHLSPENALETLVFADARGDSDFKEQIMSYIIEEKLPSRKEVWQKFCHDCPKLTIEVLNFFYDLPNAF